VSRVPTPPDPVSSQQTDHDELFKQLLTTFLIEFLELFLPEVAAFIEPGSICFLPQEYFTDLISGDRRRIDILVQAKFRGQDTCFLIHLENQAYDQKDFERRMLFYYVLLYQTYLLPIYPIALFSFDYPLKLQAQQHQVAFGDRTFLDFNFDAIQLNRLNWRDFLQSQNPVAAALMAKMRIKREDRPKVKAECLRMIATLQLDPARTQLISGFVDSYLRLNQAEDTIFQGEIGKMGLFEQEEVMQIVTSWMEQGIEQGIEQGELKMVLMILNQQLGPLAPQLDMQVRQLSRAQLESLGKALLKFSSEADLVAWLERTVA
jgi:hypothetical protein